MAQFTRALLNDSIVEWFWLIELLSVLRSVLISMGVWFAGPAGAIPQGRVHHVSRAVIDKRLSWSIQVGLVLDVLVDLDSFLLGELP